MKAIPIAVCAVCGHIKAVHIRDARKVVACTLQLSPNEYCGGAYQTLGVMPIWQADDDGLLAGMPFPFNWSDKVVDIEESDD